MAVAFSERTGVRKRNIVPFAFPMEPLGHGADRRPGRRFCPYRGAWRRPRQVAPWPGCNYEGLQGSGKSLGRSIARHQLQDHRPGRIADRRKAKKPWPIGVRRSGLIFSLPRQVVLVHTTPPLFLISQSVLAPFVPRKVAGRRVFPFLYNLPGRCEILVGNPNYPPTVLGLKQAVVCGIVKRANLGMDAVFPKQGRDCLRLRIILWFKQIFHGGTREADNCGILNIFSVIACFAAKRLFANRTLRYRLQKKTDWLRKIFTPGECSVYSGK